MDVDGHTLQKTLEDTADMFTLNTTQSLESASSGILILGADVTQDRVKSDVGSLASLLLHSCCKALYVAFCRQREGRRAADCQISLQLLAGT